MTWLLHYMGASDLDGVWYGFWSGFGGILERLIELTVIGGILWHRYDCHERGCPRIARHTIETNGHHEMFCRKHVKAHL